jgi:RNA polymerase sigma factor (sigma-70 family)
MTPRALFHPARLARRPVLSTQSDERLVDLVRAGSDPAFEAIVERYRRALMRYVSRLLPPERAEDVVQQAFVKAYEAMHRDSAELNLRPWLYRIAHNGALNALRDRGAAHAELSDTIDGVERPDQAFERTLGLRELVVAVQALPDRQRSAILLREMEGRSYEEIAAALGVSDGAVRQLLNRARNSLRAAAAAVMPMPLVERVAASDSTEPVTARVAELVGLGGGALAMKVCATALVTGAVVGGAAVVPDIGREQASRAADVDTAHAAEPTGGDSKDPSEDPTDGGGGGTGEGGADSGGRRDSDASDDGDSGPRADRDGEPGTGDDGGRGGSESGDDRSGPRGGGETDDHSGPGGGGLDSPDDHSGPGGGRLDSPDDNSGPGGGGGDIIDELTEARDGSGDSSGSGGGGGSGPDGGGSGSGSGSGSDGLPDADSLDDLEPVDR